MMMETAMNDVTLVTRPRLKRNRKLAPSAAHLHNALDRLGLTPSELSRALHLADGTVGTWIRGDVSIPAWTLVAVEGLYRNRRSTRILITQIPHEREAAIREVLTALGGKNTVVFEIPAS
jgi:hypothetical protein